MAKGPRAKRSSPVVPPSIGPQRGLELLGGQVAKAKDLVSRRAVDSTASQSWSNTTREFLIKCFGSDSQNVSSFESAGEFILPLAAYATEAEIKQEHIDVLGRQLAILESCAEQLNASAADADAAGVRPAIAVHGSFSAPVSLEPPVLRRTRADAEACIRDRVDRGRELRTSAPGRFAMGDYTPFAEICTWSEFNADLLRSLLSDDRLAREVDREIDYTDVPDHRMNRFYRELDEKLRRLESIGERLSLFSDGAQRHASGAERPQMSIPDSRNVFVVHGRDVMARDAVFRFLRSIDLNPIEWEEARRSTGKASPYVGEILDCALAAARAVIVVLTGDDLARLREELLDHGDPAHEREPTPQARPNVLFEAGMAFGRDPERALLIEIGNLRPFSDIVGRHTVRLRDGGPGERQILATRLRDAGCSVVTEGRREWLDDDFFGGLFGRGR